MWGLLHLDWGFRLLVTYCVCGLDDAFSSLVSRLEDWFWILVWFWILFVFGNFV